MQQKYEGSGVAIISSLVVLFELEQSVLLPEQLIEFEFVGKVKQTEQIMVREYEFGGGDPGDELSDPILECLAKYIGLLLHHTNR